MSSKTESPAPQTQGRFDPRKERGGRGPNLHLYRIGLVAAGLIGVAGVAYGLLARRAPSDAQELPTALAKRGDLTVRVSEGGALLALKSHEIKNEVQGQPTILEIVDEGTVITEQDVKDEKVLVRLDVSDLVEREGQREISFYNADASLTQAKENYSIQEKQNESNIAIAELNVKFARMEFERYLGDTLAKEIVDRNLEAALSAAAEQKPSADFSGLADNPGLGGMGKQALEDRNAQVTLSSEELARATETLVWTEKLYKKNYVSGNELDADKLAVTSKEIAKASAKEELRLFKQYTLPKEAEQRFADYVESRRDLERVNARARSQIAQAEADRKSKEASYDVENKRLEELRTMVKKGTILAPRPGRVVYSSTTDPWHRMRNPIRAGARLSQNQAIIIMPDLSTLAARVNIHETDIQKIQLGQRAVVTVEALPGKPIQGTVVTISPVASSAQAWLNPEIKVYETDVKLNQLPNGLTPGMTATAEIIVAELKDIIYVPVEAVTTVGGKRVCAVKGPKGSELRPIETGYFTDKYVEVKSGLKEGEAVLLEPASAFGPAIWAEAPSAVMPELSPEDVRKVQSAMPPVQPPQGAGQPAQPDQQAAAQIDQQAVRSKMRELRGLALEDQLKKIDEMQDLTPEQKKLLKDRATQFSQMTPEQRQQGGQRRGGGAEGGQAPPGP
jgi:HlyD family secretion protein